MTRKRVRFTSLEHELVGVIEYPEGYDVPKPIKDVILFHGLTNSKEDCPLINEVAGALVKNGFITFRFDFYGSGESPGKLKDKTWSILQQNALDAIAFFSRKEHISSLGIFGRSVGGTIAVLVSGNPLIKTYVLASPFVLIAKSVPHFKKVMEVERKLEAKGKVLPGTGKYKGEYAFNKRFFEEAQIFERQIMNNLTQMSHVLVLATTPDTKVPLDNATTVINAVRAPKQIDIFENTDHDYGGKEMRAVDLATEWFKRWL